MPKRKFTRRSDKSVRRSRSKRQKAMRRGRSMKRTSDKSVRRLRSKRKKVMRRGRSKRSYSRRKKLRGGADPILPGAEPEWEIQARLTELDREYARWREHTGSNLSSDFGEQLNASQEDLRDFFRSAEYITWSNDFFASINDKIKFCKKRLHGVGPVALPIVEKLYELKHGRPIDFQDDAATAAAHTALEEIQEMIFNFGNEGEISENVYMEMMNRLKKIHEDL